MKTNFLFLKILFILIATSSLSFAEIQLIKKENSDSNTTLLVIGGIHGDEPGGYFAASILSKYYDIKSKNIWVIPNLNKLSIEKNKRGVHGDMNRKFHILKKHDKDSKIIEEIKKIILEKNVSLVLNLHDGHGFYRKQNQGNIFNPNAWGQTCVIDQCKLNQDQPFGNLNTIASTVKDNMNKKLIKQHHSFDVRNTNTKFDDEAMQLSLTYFAVTNNKPAFAIESSKNLSSLSQKVFYQLLAIEEFMKIMDIEYIRKFDLNEKELSILIKNHGILTINNNILLNLSDIKKSLSYIPIKSKDNIFEFSHPLGSVKKSNGKYIVQVANKKVTTLKPQYFNVSEDCMDSFEAKVDGNIISVDIASDFFVNDDFTILENDDYRVNVIGFHSKKPNEAGVKITLKSLNKKFSVDRRNKAFRIEFYKNSDFCSMSIVKFK